MIEKVGINISNFPTQQAGTSVQLVSKPNVEVPKDEVQKKNYWLPVGLLTGGAILLYFGFRTPSVSAIVNKLVKQRVKQMEMEYNSFKKTVSELVPPSFEGLKKHISKYLEENPPREILKLDGVTDPEKILNSQNDAFDNLAKSGSEFIYQGASSVGRFAVEVDKIKRGVVDELNRKRNASRLLFEDFCLIPRPKNLKSEKVLDFAEETLCKKAQLTLGKIDEEKSTSVAQQVHTYYEQMAEAVTGVRENRVKSKRQILDASYAEIRRLFNDENFRVSYDRLLSDEEMSKIPKDALAPKKVSPELKKMYEKSFYFNSAINLDFSKISENDLCRIFYGNTYDNNLQDLRFLIDRLRLHEYVDAKSTTPKGEISDLILKLQYLSKKLDSYSKEELFKKCNLDFNAFTDEKKHSALYNITTVSRRMGFNSLKDLEQYMAGESRYSNLSIRQFIEKFIKEPEKYFM